MYLRDELCALDGGGIKFGDETGSELNEELMKDSLINNICWGSAVLFLALDLVLLAMLQTLYSDMYALNETHANYNVEIEIHTLGLGMERETHQNYQMEGSGPGLVLL
jgi:hypothetical protein